MLTANHCRPFHASSPFLNVHHTCLPTTELKPAAGAISVFCPQVVLADPKDREKDTVVFLASEHQCSSQEETSQRVAVTALHRIAGDRALHRVLPEMYRALWDNLGEHVSHIHQFPIH